MSETSELGGMRRSIARVVAGIRRRRLILTGPDGRVFLHRRGVDHKRVGLYLHRIGAPDPGLDLHDHPWPFVSLVLRGGYDEEVEPIRTASARAASAEAVERWVPNLYAGARAQRGDRRRWSAGSVHRMPLDHAHRIVSVRPGTVTLVLRGRVTRKWGFYMPHGWVAENEYDYQTRRPLSSSDGHDQWKLDLPPLPELINIEIVRSRLWRVVGDCGHETREEIPLDAVAPMIGGLFRCSDDECAARFPLRRIVELVDVTDESLIPYLAVDVEKIEPGDTFG